MVNDYQADKIKLFMGRGLLCATTASWSCKVTIWILLASLLLLSAMINGSPASQLKIEGQSSHERHYDLLATADPDNIEPTQEEKEAMTFRSTQSSHYENITAEGHIDDDLPDRLFRFERSSNKSARPKKNRKKASKGADRDGASGKGCSLKSLKIKVRDLGLGHESDEWITFNYCSGICQQTRSEYDMTLTFLLTQKKLSHGSHGRISNHPCCRPTSYLPVSFLDVNNNWKVVQKLSAEGCRCVG
ncbi:artemin [Pelodytes ibericus]